MSIVRDTNFFVDWSVCDLDATQCTLTPTADIITIKVKPHVPFWTREMVISCTPDMCFKLCYGRYTWSSARELLSEKKELMCAGSLDPIDIDDYTVEQQTCSNVLLVKYIPYDTRVFSVANDDALSMCFAANGFLLLNPEDTTAILRASIHDNNFGIRVLGPLGDMDESLVPQLNDVDDELGKNNSPGIACVCCKRNVRKVAFPNCGHPCTCIACAHKLIADAHNRYHSAAE